VTDTQWYWCLQHEVAEPADGGCPPDRRLGPYPTREAAENWRWDFERRNVEWDEADREWEGED
jgi:hypothetical protein